MHLLEVCFPLQMKAVHFFHECLEIASIYPIDFHLHFHFQTRTIQRIPCYRLKVPTTLAYVHDPGLPISTREPYLLPCSHAPPQHSCVAFPCLVELMRSKQQPPFGETSKEPLLTKKGKESNVNSSATTKSIKYYCTRILSLNNVSFGDYRVGK